jgi:hypothetical protein
MGDLVETCALIASLEEQPLGRVEDPRCSLVFIPEGAIWQWRSGWAGSTFFVIDGFAVDPLPI